ncbi:MAG: PAS domain-containing sensor histidine kinase [Caldilineaceae bacterium]
MLAAPVAILVADQHGRILFSNQRLNSLFGYEKDELFETSIEQLLPESSRGIHVQHRHGYMAAPRVRSMGSGMDLIGLRKDGTTFPIEVGLSHLEIDGHLVVMASVVDISVRKRTEEVLEERVTERTRELDRRRRISDGLATVLAMINANHPLDEILNAILGHATLILKVDACALVRNLASGGCEVQVARNLPLDYGQSLLRLSEQLQQSDIEEPNRSLAERILRSREVSQIFNLHNEPLSGLIAYDQCHRILADYGLRSELAIPLIVRNEVYGSFRLYLKYPHVFLNDELEHAQILSEQITLALENARLHADLKLAAVTAERNRIAHDLHDSVTQTLFSASMISDILPTLWQRRPEEAMRRLTELRELTRGALAEMRTLLLELRPEALENIELPELLKQLATAFVGRSRVPLDLAIDEECVVDHAARTALYRIAQEALNNVTKHANASHAMLSLTHQNNTVEMCITDDGDGFDPTRVRGNHLGLNIMRERAAEIGADLKIGSRPEKGTKVSVLWTQTNKM